MCPTLNDLHAPLQQGDTATLEATILAFGEDATLLHVVGLLGFKYGWEPTARLIAALSRNNVPVPPVALLGEAQALARATEEGPAATLEVLKERGEAGASYVARVLDLLGRQEQAGALRRALGVYLLVHAPRALLDRVVEA